MCGIHGLTHFDVNQNVDTGLLKLMGEVSTHRGSDDQGIYQNHNVGLGSNRLKIIDLPGGHQPMANGDGTQWIVFNGEIYNFAELRGDLVRAGYQFRTNS